MKNRDENLTYSSMDEKTRSFIEILTKRGILGNLAIKNKDVRTVKQKQARSSYHNTMLLLQNYRTLVWLMECFPETVAEELEQPFRDIDELLEQMDLQWPWATAGWKRSWKAQKRPASCWIGSTKP